MRLAGWAEGTTGSSRFLIFSSLSVSLRPGLAVTAAESWESSEGCYQPVPLPEQ